MQVQLAVCVCMSVPVSVCLLYSLSYIMTFVVVHQVDALSWHRMRVCAALHRLRRFVITAIRVEPQSIPLYLPPPHLLPA